MHCEPILRELAAPTGALEPAALADHLAACPPCADWAERTRQFDRLWDATRPAEPSKAAWDALWAEVSRKAGSTRPFLATIWPISGGRRARIVAVAALAQAAVLLIAGVLVLRNPAVGPGPRAIESPAVAERDEARAGSTLFICLDEKGRRVDSESRLTTPEQLRTADVEDPIPVDFWDMELINSFEGAE